MFCERVKESLSQRGVGYIDRDIPEDQEAVAQLGELGYVTTPATVIDGDVVIGFDRDRLERLLANK